ncbi:MAG: phosphotriesterase family protein [Hyphomicrobiaceae bacterium]
MQASTIEGHAMTVLGPVATGTLGNVLMHEHLICDLTPPARRGSTEPEVEITLLNAFDVNYRPAEHFGNHRLRDVALATQECTLFARAGGGTIVEMSTGGLAPDPRALARISRDSGVAIILGAGYYTEGFQDDATLALSTAEIADTIVAQLREGAWGTDVRCGIIGEIGCSWPLTPFERRSLEAGALAQQRTGASITVHPGRHPQAPHDILDILDAAGADLSRVIIDHMDRTYFDDGEVVSLARRGCVVEYDFFGIETSNYWMGVADLPTDWMRLRCIRRLFDAGLGDRVAVSHDICTRARLQTLGGHGYGHLLRNVVPLMRDRGFSSSEIAQVFVETPGRLLTIGGGRV